MRSAGGVGRNEPVSHLSRNRAFVNLESLPEPIVAAVLERAMSSEESPPAVQVSGSYAQGRADLDSALDLIVLTEEEPVASYRTWFVARSERPLHVSAALETLRELVCVSPQRLDA